MPSFTVLIPARLASTRLPNKPLADLAGKPMVVHVAERAAQSNATQVVVATDAPEVVAACHVHRVRTVLTRADHASGSDRLAEAAHQLALPDDGIVVNVQGDEPLVDPALIDAVANQLAQHADAEMATAAHPIETVDDFTNPNVVKVTTNAHGLAMAFSRAPLPWWRDGFAQGIHTLPSAPEALRHIGIYAYRGAALRAFPKLAPAPIEQCEALEQMRALWHGWRIAVHITPHASRPGVDTPQDLDRVRQWMREHRA